MSQAVYHFSASARARGVKDVGVGLALVGICGGLLYAMLIADEFSFGSLVFGPVLAIFALAGLIFVCVGLGRIVTGGQWDIRVDEKTISWQAPLMAEASFSYPPASVASIDTRIRKKTREDGRSKEKRALFLVTQDGSEHRLNKQSGVDLDAFATACADLGVARREMVIPYASRRYETDHAY